MTLSLILEGVDYFAMPFSCELSIHYCSELGTNIPVRSLVLKVQTKCIPPATFLVIIMDYNVITNYQGLVQ